MASETATSAAPALAGGEDAPVRDSTPGWAERAFQWACTKEATSAAAAATPSDAVTPAAVTFRLAVKEDCGRIMKLIRDLAAFERAADSVLIDESILVADGFGPQPLFYCVVGERDRSAAGSTGDEAADGAATPDIVAMALCFFNYSTWKGRALYLEDLYVDESLRGQGVGTRLLRVLALMAHKSCITRISWQCLDWNPAARLYARVGGEKQPEWDNWRLSDDGITKLAAP